MNTPPRALTRGPQLLLCAVCLCTYLLPLHAAEPVRALLVVGGHDFQTNQLHAMFSALPDIRVQVVEHPAAHAWLEADRASSYDVLVLYDMWQPITETAKNNFLARLTEGKGLVALHHALANYQDWPDYTKTIGGRYLLEPRTEAGTNQRASTYLHDVQFQVEIADPNHPVTRGIPSFTIHDETYNHLDIQPTVHVLLTTKEPTSHPVIAWTTPHPSARVVCIQLGHDSLAYQNPHYRKLLAQAIHWAAKHD